MGGGTRRTIERAVRLSDGWITPGGGELWELYRQILRDHGQRDPGEYPTTGPMFLWVTTDHKEKALEKLEPHIRHQIDSYGEWTRGAGMNHVEQLALAALGGTDNITINDMTGTDFRRADINLAGSAGTPDGVLDNVVVNGGNRADHVAVTGDGTTIDVAGLKAETTITGADTRDHLQINTQDGNDTVNVDPSATTLIGVTTDLGAGQV